MNDELNGVYGLALDPLADLLFFTTEKSGAQDSLFAIDTLYFGLVWSEHLTGRLWVPPAMRGNRLYTAGLDARLRAFNPADGSPLWNLATPYPLVGLVAPSIPPYHDRLFVRDFFGNVYCARDNGSTATLEWSTPIPIQTAFISKAVLVVDPVAGAVYVGGDDGRIYQLDAASGAVERTIVLDATPSVVNTMLLDWPVKDGERVELLAGTSAGTLARICAKDGRILRNSLDGPENRTAGTSGFPSYLDTDTGEVSAWVQQLDTPRSMRLTHFEAVASGPGPCDLGRGPTPCLEQMDYLLMGWGPSGPLGDLADPGAPEKAFHMDVTNRLTLVRGYGSSRLGGGDLRETTLLSFDLEGLDLRLPRDGRVALVGRGSGSLHGELVLPYLENAEESDAYYPPGSSVPVFQPQAAVRIRGEPWFHVKPR